jgi:hypothetical protein
VYFVVLAIAPLENTQADQYILHLSMNLMAFQSTDQAAMAISQAFFDPKGEWKGVQTPQRLFGLDIRRQFIQSLTDVIGFGLSKAGVSNINKNGHSWLPCMYSLNGFWF